MSWLEPISDRLAWTLAHFLWQGLAWMGLCSAAIALFRIRDPAMRYRVQLAALIGMAVSPIAAFAILSMPRDVEPPPANVVVEATQERPLELPSVNAAAPTAETSVSIPRKAPSAPVLPATIDFAPMEQPPQRPAIDLGNAAVWIVSAWLAGVVALGTWLAIGLLGTWRLRVGSSPAPAELTDRAARWAAAMGLRSSPTILISPRVREPMTAGLLRPIVLLPQDWPLSQPAAFLDACLAHELAHLRRGDLWTNLVQRLIEAALYFHPCVWRLSARLRLDRELCCDAMAAEAMGDRLTYVSALERVATLRLGWAIQPVALGVGGRRKTLLLRVCSLLGQAPKPRYTAAALTGLLAITISLTIGLALAIQTPNLVASAPDAPVAEDEIAEPATTLVGTVVDLAGKPVAGAEVLLFRDGRRIEPPMKTDDRGEFPIQSAWMVEDAGYSFIAKSNNRMGWFDVWANGMQNPQNRRRSPHLTLLPRTRILEGTFVDPEVRPLEGVTVAVEMLVDDRNFLLRATNELSEALAKHQVTDKNGRFKLLLPAEAGGNLRLGHPDYPEQMRAFGQLHDDIGQVNLGRPGSIIGMVTDSAGRPVARASVFAQQRNEAKKRADSGSAYSDGAGHYIIRNLEPGDYIVKGSKRTDRTLTTPVQSIRVEAGKTTTTDFQISPGTPIRGRLTSKTGKPISGFFVSCRLPSGSNVEGPLTNCQTNERGEFVFYVPPGKSSIWIDRPGSAVVVDVISDKPPDPVQLVVPWGDNFRRVTRKSDEQPKSGQRRAVSQEGDYRLKVNLNPSDGNRLKRILAASHKIGAARSSMSTKQFSGSGYEIEVDFDEQDDGQLHVLIIDAEGYPLTQSPLLQVSRRMEPISVTIPKTPVVAIHGQVIDERGLAVTGAKVRTGRSLHSDEDQFPWGPVYETDAEGRFVVTHARQGERLYIRADKSGKLGGMSERFNVKQSEPMELAPIRIVPSTTMLERRVVDQWGSPIAGAKILYDDLDPRGAVTDKRGRFELIGLPSGPISLTIEANGFIRQTTIVRPGSTEPIRLQRP